MPGNTVWSNHEQFLIAEQINKLLSKGAIERCSLSEDQILSSIFLVPKPDKTFRLILNLKGLNEFIEMECFKVEDYKVVKRLIGPHDFMATLDLKDAYYLISIAKNDRKYLSFMYGGEYFEFTCLPFGLDVASYVVTKILKPVAAYLRKRSLRSVFYLDDMLIIGKSYEECAKNVEETRKLVQELGFIVNEQKSQIIPTQRCRFLGFIFDSLRMSIELPEDKVQRTVELLNQFSRIRSCTIREFAAFVGTLVSRYPALKYEMIYIRPFEKKRARALGANNDNYDAKMSLLNKFQEEFTWWKMHIRPASAPMSEPMYDLEIFSDASRTGWGVFCKSRRGHGYWNGDDLEFHINVLELMAVFFGLKCFASGRRRCNILLCVDNTTAIAYINRRRDSHYQRLSSLGREICQRCEQREIWISASYIRSSKNVEADHESRRLQPETEFELSDSAFRKITEFFGCPQIDLFASRANSKCHQYVSWQRDPVSFAINAFTLEWKKWFFYAFLPFSVILKVLRKIKRDRANGIVVVPYWEVQPWFPLFLSLIEAEPIFFHLNINLIRSSSREPHPVWHRLTLVAAKLSGKSMFREKFLWNRWIF